MRNSRWIDLGAGAIAALAALTMFSAPSATPSPAAGPKTHALYMGADIKIQYQGKLYSIVSVVGDSLIIEVDGKRTPVALIHRPVAVKVDDVLRLGRTEVTLTNLKAEQAYTAANDPRQKMLSAPVPMAAPGQMAVTAQVQYDVTMNNLPRDHASAVAKMAEATRNRDQAFNQTNADTYYAMEQQTQMQRELDKQLFDAMDIRFDVASERVLHHPYVIGVAQIKERDAKPREIRYWFVAKELDPIGPEPQRIQIQKGGLPEGFSIVSFHLHLYDGGIEVPTAVSSKRVLLTRDEAYQYVMLEYLSSHKKDTLPPTPALADVPAEIRVRVEEGELTHTYHVKVDRDGNPGEVFLDPACAEPLTDPAITAVFQTVRFKPALANGQPVEGTAAVKLRQLIL